MDLDVNASRMALATVRSEYESAFEKVSALLSTLARLRELRRSVHISPVDSSTAIGVLRDQERTEVELERAVKTRDDLEKLVEDMTKAHERAERERKVFEAKSLEPAAKEALAESKAKFAEWCKSHAMVEKTMREAGLVTYGATYQMSFGQIIHDHGLHAVFGK